MNRAQLIRLSARLANSLSSTRQPGLHSLRLNQVTHFSHLTQSPTFSRNPHFSYVSPNSHQSLYFSTTPDSLIKLILSKDWSEEFEVELGKLNPRVNHESVVYVLKKLNKNPKKSLDFYKWVRDKKGFEPRYVPCTILLKTLASREFLKDFWDVAKEMKEKGFCIDKHIYGAINGALERQNLVNEAGVWTKFYETMHEDNGENDAVKGVVEVVMGSEWNEGVESKLMKLGFPLTENVVFRVVWNLREEPLMALKFFEWIASCRKFEHNSVTYSRMARVLALGGLMDEFWNLVTKMRSEGYEIDNYVKLARCLGKEDAVKLFELMMDGPYKPTETECNWLLKMLAHELDPDIELVNRVVNKYVGAGNTHTKALYDGLHRSLCKAGQFDEAKKVVEDLRNAGYKPDNITYSQEVFGLCRLKRFEDAVKVLNQMEAEGCVPDIKTWTILIQGYCIAGQMDEALSCFAQMPERNLDPDADLLMVLIEGFLSQDKLLGAYKFLVEMVNKACIKPWQATYKLMIEKLVQNGKLNEAFNLLSMMKQQEYPPYPEPFAEYISKSGTVEDANKLLEAVPMNGLPSTEAYVNVITSFFNKGRHSEAKDLLYGSPSHVRRHRKIKKLFGSKPSINSPS
ncbi:pentatricopeptide repeat-containing protein At3g48250, chloroplastic-like [Chenopodium quinoa]|uniref:Pentatricopeptide repeat-containing protein n=1 Tax=Chenopodium quinoa TaxID=63459 RepID=A0A803MFX9_CHEQI|nr:pentatricopeptide repeat-containing protein At3g48250, chloroplastic-like [Chenopodium quinoa]